MRYLLVICLLLALFTSRIMYSNNGHSKKIAIFPLANMSGEKSLNYLSDIISTQLFLKFKSRKSVKVRSYKKELRYKSILSLAKAYRKWDYIIYGEFIGISKTSVHVKIHIISVKEKAETNTIEFRLPKMLKSNTFRQIADSSNKVLWSILGVPFQVYSKPSDAEFYIGKKFIGRTPLKRLVGKEGDHNVIVYKKGYQIVKQNITLSKEKNNIFFYNLKPKLFIENKSKLSIKYNYALIQEDNTSTIPYIPLLFSFEYYIKSLSVEFETGITNLSHSSNIKASPGLTESKTISLIPVTLAAKYHFIPDYPVSPYIGLGGGLAFMSVAETRYSEINPMVFATLGLNITMFSMDQTSARFGLFIESKYFLMGDLFVGEASFNPYGVKTVNDKEIAVNGFAFCAGISYTFF